MSDLDSINDYFQFLEQNRAAFLAAHGWGGAQCDSVGQDGSARRYFRLTRDNDSAILMEALPDGHPHATWGHRLGDFIMIGNALASKGFHTPALLAQDVQKGYLLLSDMGDVSFKKAVAQELLDETTAYRMATQTLIHLHDDMAGEALPSVPYYYDSHVHKGMRRVVEWFLPAFMHQSFDESAVAEFISAWGEIERGLAPCPQGLLHIDFHFENLMFIEGGADARQKTGLLDFQGAMMGPLAYDLVNLLEDARVSVPQQIQREMIDLYCAVMSAEEKALFLAWYRILGTQFHCRVMGQFVKLAYESGKMHYLAHIPRLQAYIASALDDPLLLPLKAWFVRYDIDLSQDFAYDLNQIKAFVAKDAF